MHYIFRKTDKEWLYATTTSDQHGNEMAACLANEGGQLRDYVVVKNDDKNLPTGMIPELQPDNTVRHVASPAKVDRDRARASIAAKLKTAGLNLTDVELALLTRG